MRHDAPPPQVLRLVPRRAHFSGTWPWLVAGGFTLAGCRDLESPKPQRPAAVLAPGPEGKTPPSPEPEPEPAPAPAPAQPSAAARTPNPPGPRWTFEDGKEGELPAGWTAPVGQWRVETTESATGTTGATGATGRGKVFVQRAKSRSPVFNLAMVEDGQPGDVDITVGMRARAGRIDQGGGIVWRAKDARNYYIARYNPLEDNYRLYTVKDGRRKQLESADVKVDGKAWHTVRIKMVGDRIECFLDGKKFLERQDRTFTGPGMVGLWTKADALTQFDDLSVTTPAAMAP